MADTTVDNVTDNQTADNTTQADTQNTTGGNPAGAEATASKETSSSEPAIKYAEEDKGKDQQQDVEGEGDKSSDSDADKTEDKVPEQYEAFKTPDGVNFSEGVMSSFSEVAKQSGLSQEKAQAIIDKVAPAIVEGQQEQLKQLRDSWRQETLSDEVLGGTKHEASMAVVSKALDTFGSPDLKKLLDETGLGEHPEINRLLYKVGTKISEDTITGGSGNKQGRLYGQIRYGKN